MTYGSIGTPWPAYRTQKSLSPGGRTIDATCERGHVIAGTVPGDGEFNPAETDQVSYEYDSVDGSLLSISSESLIGEVAAVSNTYDNENGYLATRTMPGVTTTFSYDTAGQVVSADSALAGGTTFSYLTTYNSRGEVTTMGTWTYQYDGAGRMIGAYDSESAVGWTYEYDAHSNRTGATSSEGYAQNLTYSPGDRITSPGFAYDGSGRLISDTAPTGERRSFYYDGYGQLTGVDLYDPASGHARNIRMSYDGLGKLVERSNYIDMAYLADKTTYRYDGDRLIGEEDETGTIATYLYTDDQAAPVGMKYRQANGTFANYFFVTNPHGDVVAVTDRDGAVVNQYAYGPWGEQTRISEQVHQPFRYGGYYFDDTTGLYWLTTRFYEPTTGRFLSKDSANPDLRDVKSLNSYIYADDAPATHVDPEGLSPVKPRSSGPWKPKVGPPKPKPQPFKPKQMGGGTRESSSYSCARATQETVQDYVLGTIPYAGRIYDFMKDPKGGLFRAAAAAAITAGIAYLNKDWRSKAAITVIFGAVSFAVGTLQLAAAALGSASGCGDAKKPADKVAELAIELDRYG